MASKRTVLITGCSDGSLGSALSLAFHKAGWRVFASARNPSKLKEVEAAGIEIVQLDTLSEESIAGAVARVSELLTDDDDDDDNDGSLDVLVNNAGAGYSMPLLDVDMAKARHLFDLNVISPLMVTRAFLPLLRRSKARGGGMVVNNTSCSGTTAGAQPFAGIYAASKAAALNLTEVLRLELAPFDVRVVNLMTGSIKSTFHENTPGTTLPPDSIYNVAKETVEKTMSGADMYAVATEAADWAEAVVRDLGRSSPPHWIWRGKLATVVRLAALLPIGWVDRIIRCMAGLDVVERKVKEQEKAAKQG